MGVSHLMKSGVALLFIHLFVRLLVWAPGSEMPSSCHKITAVGSTYICSGPSLEKESFLFQGIAVHCKDYCQLALMRICKDSYPMLSCWVEVRSWVPTVGGKNRVTACRLKRKMRGPKRHQSSYDWKCGRATEPWKWQYPFRVQGFQLNGMGRTHLQKNLRYK